MFTTDLAKQAQQAFDYAVGLAGRYGAGRTILFVMEDTPQVYGEDLIVMGYHAKGRLKAAVAGSVSCSVLRKVDIPVLLVKLPEGG